jgi:hypothetical protein
MKHRRINIQVRDDVDPAIAVARVAEAMRGGRVSGDGKYYCWVTTFTDGTVVYTRGPSAKVVETSDSFIVYKEKHEVSKEKHEASKETDG